MLKRIAVIEGSHVRDTQIFTTDPILIENDEDGWEENFCDVKYPCHYVGIFEGVDESEIRRKAAESEGVHIDTISLISFDGI